MLNFDGNRLSHAYICNGNAADLIAATVVCSDRNTNGPCNECKNCMKSQRHIHPDIITIEKLSDKKDIIVEQIRNLKLDVIVVSNEALKKVYIINDAHLMNLNAQNAFLQILEEPPAHVVFILKTDYPSKLIPTILSRCVITRDTVSQEKNAENINEIDSAELASAFFSNVENGNSAILELMFTIEKLNKEQFIDFISSTRKKAAFLLSSNDGSYHSLPKRTIAFAEELLAQALIYLDQNVSIGHISGLICANLIKINLPE